MEPTLIVGAETVAGASLARELATTGEVIAATVDSSLSFVDCETLHVDPRAAVSSVRDRFAAQPPARIVLCTAAAISSWEDRPFPSLERFQAQTQRWSEIAAEWNCGMVLISSDAVFRGPWMFHSESSDSFCPSPEAVAIRQAERSVLDLCPRSLILRTHVLGWSPTGEGWLEELVDTLTARRPHALSATRHASPLAAPLFQKIAAAAIAQELHGLHHLAGAERINPARLADLVAGEFGLPAPLSISDETEDSPSGLPPFGHGECSLRTRKLRESLGISVPLITESLRALREGQPHRTGSAKRPAKEFAA